MKRIGILSGTFDPVHKGHISFALQAAESAGLDIVYVIPEPKPRHKADVTHVSHRLEMIRLGSKAYKKVEALELPDKQFTVATSLPRLKQKFPHAQLLLLVGVDVLAHMSVWPHIRTMLKEVGLVVAVRGQKDERHAFELLSKLPVEPSESHVLVSNYKMAASRDIRADLKKGKEPKDVLNSVIRYANKNWIYTSFADSLNKS